MGNANGITIDEFEQLPAALVHYRELIDGELVDVSGNTADHNSLRDFLIVLLRPYVKERKLGKVISEQDFEFDDNVHAPDVSFISAPKIWLIKPNLRVQRFVPDMAIEIVSENDKFRSLMKKTTHYRKCGTKEVWVLDPETRKAVVLSEEREVILDHDQMFESKLIPGFSIRLADLFDEA
jgi:Uma2 family endonuclease